MRKKTSKANNEKIYKSSKSKMKQNHKAIYIIGSIGITAASIIFLPRIIDELSRRMDSYK